MNAVMQLLLKHRSIRRFRDDPIESALLHDLLRCGQAAATSSFMQAVSVIRVSQPDTRRAMASLAGNQAYVESAPEFLVFCADLRRAALCCGLHGEAAVEGMTEHFIIATVDVALFAQNLVVAAESAGLGVCYIGGIRNDPLQVCELLQLPDGVYPVFGLCLGYPAQDPQIKPRLPLPMVLQQDVYSDVSESLLADYDAKVAEYYRSRSANNKVSGWSGQMAAILSNQARPHMLGFLQARGFLKR